MDPALIEEINRTRIAQGMKPLPVPGASASSGPQFKDKSNSDDEEEPASTLETREAAAYDNYKKVQEAEAAKKTRQEKLAAIKKAREAAQRFEKLEGHGLGEADESEPSDARSWLISQKKRQRQIDKARKLEKELAAAEAAAAAAVQYTSKDLAGVKVAHEIGEFEEGDDQILTLKDSNVLGEEDEGDELENINLRERERLQERLQLKKKKPLYDPHEIDETGDHSILAQYDEEISGKKMKRFTLDEEGIGAQNDSVDGQPQTHKLQKISLDFLKDEQPSSDYLDVSDIKVKKHKKKKKPRQTRQRSADEDDIFPPEPTLPGDDLMDVDTGAAPINKKRKVEDSTFVDDEDLQATLARQRREALKKRKKSRPEDLARQLREESQAAESEDTGNEGGAGLVIDSISEFVSGLKKEDEEERKPRKSKTPNPDTVTAMEDDSDEDERMRDEDDDERDARQRESSTPADLDETGVGEEKTIGAGAGLGSTLQLLRERHLLETGDTGNLNETYRQQSAFQAEKKRRLQQIEEEARRQRERERMSGKFDRMSTREKEEWARQQNNIRDLQASRQMVDLFNKGYKPNVELTYMDELGRELDQKEAFKHLSHQFHGKGSGKGKTDKRLKKIEDEKRRQAQSILDASQSVGMSSAAAQQTKKRKEAGVRLA